MASKYIVFDRAFAVVFSEAMTHRDVAESIHRINRSSDYRVVTGAGFVSIGVSKDCMLEVEPYGRSESLDIDCDKVHDADALRTALGLW